MTTKLPTWADVRKIADDLEKKVQLAGAAMKERWNHQFKPKLEELDKKIEEKGQRAGEVIQQQLTTIGKALEQLRDELAADLKLGKKPETKQAAPSETPVAEKPADKTDAPVEPTDK